jgi:flavin reductase (DIM6/NTAB) family NADH-FMN oxidoreductase RutF
LDCRVVSQLPLGDHTLVALEVLGSSSLPTAVPLVYHDGKVISVDSHE